MNQYQPAFPLPRPIDETLPNIGLTKREYFAAMAMQGLLANPELFKIAQALPPNSVMKFYNQSAIEHADDLLKQLEQ